MGLLNISILWHIPALGEIDISSRREWSKKSVQQGRSLFDARSVLSVREHGKRARTPLATFFNIPLILNHGHAYSNDPRITRTISKTLRNTPRSESAPGGPSPVPRSGWASSGQTLSTGRSRLRRILSQFPAHADSLHLRGLLAYQQGHNSLAVTCIEQAIAQDPSKPHYHFNFGLVMEKEERWDDAIVAYRQACRLNPAYVEAMANLGNVYRRQRQWEEAITTFQQALTLKPQSPDLHNNLGVVYKEKGAPDQALDQYRQALALAPQHAEALNNMGVVLQDQGKLAEAAEAFHQALTLKPAYANAHYHLGLVRLWQGQEDAALSCFQRSADLTYNHGRGMAPAFVTKARVKHDYEQLYYLAAQAPAGPLPGHYQEVLTTLYHRIAQSSSDSIFLKLTSEEQMQMAPSFNRFVSIRPTGRLEGSAVNPSLNIEEIETRYFSTSP